VESADGATARENGLDTVDESRHVAKVMVAGSNPVFRSKLPTAEHQGRQSE
jgi:hypothetical protein